MCIFCKIINKEIPSYTVYEDDYVVAFLDISQATIGHTLVLPKKHYDNIYEMNDEICSKIFPVVKNLAKAVKKATNCKGINILNNNEATAGQSVNHFHIHIIPRYEENDLEIKFNSNELSNDEFNKLLNSIKNSI